MKGLRTLVVAFVGGPLSAWIVTHLGLHLTDQDQAYVVGAVMSGLMVVMRFITNGPVKFLEPRKLSIDEWKAIQLFIKKEAMKLVSDDIRVLVQNEIKLSKQETQR